MMSAVISAFLMAATAPASPWAFAAYFVIYDDGRYANLPEQVVAPSVRSSIDGGANLMLYCPFGSMRANVVLPGGSLGRELDGRVVRHFGLYIDGERVHRGQADYFIENSFLSITSSEAASKLFNAAVREQSVDIEIRREGRYQLAIAPVNDDFRNFADQCANLREEKANRR